MPPHKRGTATSRFDVREFRLVDRSLGKSYRFRGMKAEVVYSVDYVSVPFEHVSYEESSGRVLAETAFLHFRSGSTGATLFPFNKPEDKRSVMTFMEDEPPSRQRIRRPGDRQRRRR